jgi:hypothetical protein
MSKDTNDGNDDNDKNRSRIDRVGQRLHALFADGVSALDALIATLLTGARLVPVVLLTAGRRFVSWTNRVFDIAVAIFITYLLYRVTLKSMALIAERLLESLVERLERMVMRSLTRAIPFLLVLGAVYLIYRALPDREEVADDLTERADTLLARVRSLRDDEDDDEDDDDDDEYIDADGVECPYCDATFPAPLVLSEHIATTHEDDDKPTTVPIEGTDDDTPDHVGPNGELTGPERCQALTADETQCGNKAIDGTRFCHLDSHNANSRTVGDVDA